MTLDYDDLMQVWKAYGCEASKEPFRYMNRFFGYYESDYPHSPKPPYRYDLGYTHGDKAIEVFSHALEKHLKVDECFLYLLDGMPKSNKLADTKRLFDALDKKYPEFYSGLTDALNTKNHFALIPDYLTSAWISLSKKKKVSFPQKEVFHFIAEMFYSKDSFVTQKISALTFFDKDKAHELISKVLESQNGMNPQIIAACEDTLERLGIDFTKKNLPLFAERKEQLFHYEIEILSNGIVQQFHLSDKETTALMKFATYYLDNFAYYANNKQRDVTETKAYFKMASPYEFIRDEAQEKYKEALSVILSEEFIDKCMMSKLITDPYSDTIAQNLKDRIPAILLNRQLDSQLEEKETASIKKKI